MSDELKKAEEDLGIAKIEFEENPTKENMKAWNKKAFIFRSLKEKGKQKTKPLAVRGYEAVKSAEKFIVDKYQNIKKKNYTNLGSRKPTKNPLD